MVNTDETPLSPKELAKFLGCGEEKAREFFRKNCIPGAYKIGNHHFCDLSDARAFKNTLRGVRNGENHEESH